MTTPEQDDANQMLLQGAGQNNIDQVNNALELGAEVNTQSGSGNTPLALAAYNGNWGICEALIKASAKLDIPNNEGNTPLFMAVNAAKSDVCLKLIDAGADVDVRDKLYYTPLMKAAECGMADVCRKLLDKDVNIEATFSALNYNACMLAAMRGQQRTVKMLMRAGLTLEHEQFRPTYVQPLYEVVNKAFPLGKLPTAEQCLDEGKIHDDVLDACIIGQFDSRIAGPLLEAKQYPLFLKIWDTLPERWRQENQGIYIEYTKLTNGITPPVMNPPKEGRVL